MTVETQEQDIQPQATEDGSNAPTFKDEMQRLSFEQLSKLIKERNSYVGTANAANGAVEDLIEQLTEESTDPEIVQARTARNEAVARLEALVTPKVEQMKAEKSEGLGDVETKIKEIDSALKPGVTYYKKIYGDDAGDFLPKQTRLRGMSISNAGTGGRRVRGFNVSITVDGEVTDFENFATAAKFLDVDTATLQNAFFSAAGNPKQVKDAPDKVSFTATFKDEDEDGNEIERTASVYAYRPEAENGSDEGDE